MITVSTTDLGEADDMAGILAESLPPEWDYRIYLQGREYAARDRRLPHVQDQQAGRSR